MDYRHQMLVLATNYHAATGRSPARVGVLAVDSGSFFKRIGAGQGCSVDTYLKVKRWFADNWPAGTAWPEGVDGVDVPPRLADNPMADNPMEGAAQAADAA